MSNEHNEISIVDWNSCGFFEEGVSRFRLCKKIDATGSVVRIDLQQLFITTRFKDSSRTETWKDVEYAEELINE